MTNPEDGWLEMAYEDRNGAGYEPDDEHLDD